MEVDADSVRAPGWTLTAKVEHMDNGNLITTYPIGQPFPEAWRTCAPMCEHCRRNRDRNVTFMVRSDDGVTHQVGSSCLRDYTGINPASVIAFAEVVTFLQSAEATGDQYDVERHGNLFPVRTATALAVAAIAKHGFVRSDAPGATAVRIRDELRDGYTPDAAAYTRADEIMKWALSPDLQPAEVLVAYDLRPLIEQGWCKLSHVGRIAYLPRDYEKWCEHRERERQRQAAQEAAKAGSHHIGTVGERITVPIRSAALVTSWDTNYGTTYLYRFMAADGATLVWFASSPCEVTGATKITGTVKKHDERDGVAQTVLTRCPLSA